MNRKNMLHISAFKIHTINISSITSIKSSFPFLMGAGYINFNERNQLYQIHGARGVYTGSGDNSSS